LINKGFEIHPKFLWITLLTACQTQSKSPILQGFEHIARKISSAWNRYKSSTYKKTEADYFFFNCKQLVDGQPKICA
jgi:hypothetical protein